MEYPDYVDMPILGLSILLPVVTAVIAGGEWWFAAAIVTMPVTASFLFLLLRPLAELLPAQCYTLGDLAKVAVGLNYGALVQEYGRSGDRSLFEALRRMVADLTDIDYYVLINENPRLIDIVLESEGFRNGA